MPRRGLRGLLTVPNVLSTLAVFLVLAGGTAFAAGLKKNSVNSRTVRDNSLTSADLANGKGVTGADVADGSLAGADVADGSLGRTDLAAAALTGAHLADDSIGGAKVGSGEIGRAHLGFKSVNAATIRDGAIRDADFAARTITGRNVDESTLEPVGDTAKLAGAPAGAYVSSSIYQPTSALERGLALGDGTFRITESCLPGDVILSGGHSDLDPGSSLVESFPKNGTWTVRINPHGRADSFRVVLACTNQAGLPR